ncbi:4257_t:CDS:2, partial [Racocetra persica]
AGITILNEIGVDLGIDYLSAMKIIDDITSFISWCGGLPAQEAFKKHNILDGELLKFHFPTVSIDSNFEFEGLANRDSLSYIDTYGLASLEIKDAMLRGILRYK